MRGQPEPPPPPPPPPPPTFRLQWNGRGLAVTQIFFLFVGQFTLNKRWTRPCPPPNCFPPIRLDICIRAT
jgi:hypothetical protein